MLPRRVKRASLRLADVALAVLVVACAAAPPHHIVRAEDAQNTQNSQTVQNVQTVHADLVARVLEQHLLPGFAALKAAAEELPPAIASHCATLSDQGKARAAFEKTAIALARVDFYRFGPLADKGRRERLSFWPDPRGVVQRQVRQALAARDVKLLEPGALAQQSAALQGLPALDVLLDEAGTGDAAARPYACDLAVAVARNVAVLAQEVDAAWSQPGGAREGMLHPGAPGAIYKSHTEAAGDLLKALLTGLQAVLELQLKPRLEGAKPGLKGPYARLGLQQPVYAAATQSLRKLYDVLDLEARLAPEKNWIKNWTGGAWRAIAMSDGMGGPSPGTPKASAPKLAEVVSRMGGLRMLIGKEMSNAAGLSIGFNELDGD